MNIVKTVFLVFIILCCNKNIAQINIDSLERILEKESVDSIRFKALDLLAGHYAYHGKDEARPYISQIKQLALKYSNDDYLKDAYRLSGNLAERQNKADSARYYYVNQLKLANGDSAEIGSIFYSYSGSFYRESQYDSLLIYGNRALNLLERYDPHNHHDLAKTCNLLGIGYELTQQYKLSIEFYQKALNIKRNLGDKRSEINTLSNLSGVYSILGNEEQSFYYNAEMLKLAEEINDLSAIATANHTLGVKYKNKGEFEKAKYHLEKAKELRLREGYTHGACYTLYVLGNLYRDKSEPNEALKQYDTALKVCQDGNVIRTIGNIHTNRSRVFTQLGKYKEAIAAADLAKIFADKVNTNENIMSAYQASSEAYEKLENYKNAYYDYKKYDVLRDSSEQLKYDSEVQSLQIQFESIEKQSVIDSQHIEILKKTSQRNRYLFGFVSICILSTFLMYRNRYKEKLHREKVINLEQKQKLLAVDYMLQGQEEERKRIARDLHDGLGGILASARLQMRNVEKEIDKLSELALFTKAEKLIDNACSEVRRIAHDMMPDALVNLGFRDAIEDLISQVSFNESLSIESYFSHNQFSLNESQSVIMYRIIQEIISNALKHAQADRLEVEVIETEKGYYFTIKDNGVGFNVSLNAQDGIGLKNIKNRIQYLNGKLEILSAPDSGTTFEMSIPK